jgi:hypothetical protein
MTYYQDLTAYCYFGMEDNTFNVGWLRACLAFEPSWSPAGCVARSEPASQQSD